jgi:hypothetical protein
LEVEVDGGGASAEGLGFSRFGAPMACRFEGKVGVGGMTCGGGGLWVGDGATGRVVDRWTSSGQCWWQGRGRK